MRYVTSSLGVVLAVFALLQIGQPQQLLWIPVFGGSAALAFLTLRHWKSLMLVRLFAVLSALAMFWFFAGFFRLAPHLHPDWYERAAALDAIGLLFSGFAMIMVLSEYSCRMKRDRREHQGRDASRPVEPRSAASHSPSGYTSSSRASTLSTPATAPHYRTFDNYRGD